MSFVPDAPAAWQLYRRFVRTEVQFFARTAPLAGTDVLKLNNMPAPVPGVANLRRATVLIDLTQDEEALLAAIDAKERKKIRQAEREGIRVERFTEITQKNWQDFLAAYAKLRQRKKMADALALGQVHELAKNGWLGLSASYDGEGTPLSWHVYILSHGVARLYSTVSDIDPAKGSPWNNMVGRAHRLHHWHDMLRCKADGVRTYDFGGVYRGSTDQEQLNIARFKTGFGGEFADTFDAALPLTAWGRTALSFAALMKTACRHEPPEPEIESPVLLTR
jgi:hypothetical protein